MRAYLSVLAAICATFLLAVALPAYGGTVELYTLRGFVDMLIEKNIVPVDMAEKARELASFISSAESVVHPRAPYADAIDVSASQLIEYSFRTYEQGDEVRGIILLAENTTQQDVYPTAVRGCQITYRIFNGDEIVYDSATKHSCATDEVVSYRLAPGQTRMFEVRHKNIDYPLDRGLYRMEISYPGYGKGTRTFEVY
jgi:hypothetical protein